MRTLFSIIIPARNEVAQLPFTLDAALRSVARLDGLDCERLHLNETSAEVIVVDNASADGTAAVLQEYGVRFGVRCIHARELGAARARNQGAAAAKGRILVFIDADTWIPETSLLRVRDHVCDAGMMAGIFRLGAQQTNVRAAIWWAFWNNVRRLPLPRAKALPAFMFCTRDTFDAHGPFDEVVAIGEEWPILAGVYRNDPSTFVYDRTITALTSGRRMEMQRFGYLRTYVKYCLAILSQAARVRYTDTIREQKA